jgi:predicted phosphodiesterase
MAMKRTFTILALLLASCHSVTIVVERRSSGAVERDFDFTPTPDRAGHYIAFPANPFVNCLDAVHLSSGKTANDIGTRACADSDVYAGFLGYDPATEDTTWRGDDAHQQSALDTIWKEAGGTGAAPAPESAFSFMHLSDVQIREPEAKLGGGSVSHKLDKIIQSFERDYDQERYSMFVYGAIVETINREHDLLALQDKVWGREHEGARPTRIPPQFMIHTGDSVDAGLKSEFQTFVRFSDRLEIPWYQVVGNHDVLAFGNLRMSTKVPDPENKTERIAEDGCLSDEWGNFKIHCTCTRVAGLLREYSLRAPNNRGVVPPGVPDKPYTAIPIALKRICLVHSVDSDSFVMDPDSFDNLGPAQTDKDVENLVARPTGGTVTKEQKRQAQAALEGNTINAFIAQHCDGTDLKSCGAPPLADQYAGFQDPSKRETTCAELADSVSDRSKMHGFDISPEELNRTEDARTTKSAFVHQFKTVGAHYCFEIQSSTPGRRAWAIVLNTSTIAGAYGEISAVQTRWLTNLLEGQPADKRQIKSSDLVFVFAHHPIWDIYTSSQREKLLKILSRNSNVVAYLTGHTHESGLRVVPPTADHPGHPFWEVIAPSTLAYPQQARQITVKMVGDKLGYLEILSFSPDGTGDSDAKLRRAIEGATRDKCHEAPAKCDAGRPRLPGSEVTFPRLWFVPPPLPPTNGP